MPAGYRVVAAMQLFSWGDRGDAGRGAKGNRTTEAQRTRRDPMIRRAAYFPLSLSHESRGKGVSAI